MQAHNAQHNFTYNAQLAQHFSIDDSDPLGLFVNCNAATVRYAVTNELDAAHTMFEGLIANAYTTVNDDASPVYVYMHNNTYIAWYDWENMCGYIATTQAVAQAA